MTNQGVSEPRVGVVPLTQAEPAAAAGVLIRQPGPLVRMGLALTTGGLLWLCYFPAACGYLAWVALVPLLTLVRSPGRAVGVYLAAWVGGLAFYWPALQWMRVADDRMYFTWAFLATYCALYFPLALFLVRFLDRRTPLPLVVSVPVVWTALEYFRCLFGTGFSWYLLGHSQHRFLPVIQVSDLTGAYGVSFLVAAVNALLAEALYARPWFRARFVSSAAGPRWSPTLLLAQGGALLAVLLGAFAYGEWRLGQGAGQPGPRVALIQGSVDQRIRNQGPETAQVMRDHHSYLSDLAAAHRPDLIVWPETSFPGYWKEVKPGVPTLETYNEVYEKVAPWRTNVLLGMNAAVRQPDGHVRLYNSAVLMTRGGRPAGRYDKIHRVPFGEYVPLRDWFPWMKRFAPYDFEYSVWPGEHFTRFPLEAAGRRYTFGVLICYEDTDPDLARPYGGGDGQAPADFVLNISNDGWFNGSSEHDEHLAVGRFRAVECRRAVARAVNMGISAVIDGNGRVLRPRPLPGPGRDGVQMWEVAPEGGKYEGLPVSEWDAYKKVPGFLLATLPIDGRVSLYARWGDWLPWGCWGIVVVGLAFGLWRGRAGRQTA